MTVEATQQLLDVLLALKRALPPESFPFELGRIIWYLRQALDTDDEIGADSLCDHLRVYFASGGRFEWNEETLASHRAQFVPLHRFLFPACRCVEICQRPGAP